MKITDPIADMFTRIRNAIHARHEELVVPFSGIKNSIAQILKDEGFINVFEVVEDEHRKGIKIKLKYNQDGSSIIQKIERVSKPGKRVYVQKSEVPKVQNGFGICIVSTNKGILDGRSARLNNVGGELLGIIY